MFDDISEGFLGDPIQTNGNLGWNLSDFLVDTEPDANPFKAGELPAKTAERGNQSQMFKRCRMKLVRDQSKVVRKTLCAMTKVEYGLEQLRRFRRHLASQESELDRKHGQLLIQAIMQFSSNTPSLLFLGLQKFSGQIL
jgi:hypothetical protein